MFHHDPLEPLHYQVILETARQRQADYVRHLLRRSASKPGNRPHGLFVVPFVFLPLACGYLLSYVFRTINGSIADELIHEFSLNAGSLGLLTSDYFLAFAISAILIGVALDAFGPRLVQGCLMSIAAVGAVVFAMAPGPFALVAGRTLIGLGVAGGLMAGLKAHALWIPPRYLPLANGGLMMFGGLGAIVATLPVGVIDTRIGWRGTFLLLAAVSLAASVSVFALVPRRPASEGRLRSRDALQGFIDAVTDRRFLRVAPLSASVVGTSFAIHGLWAARWLKDVDCFAPDDVLDGLLAIGAGLTLGSLAIGVAAMGLAKLQVSCTKAFGWFCAAFIALQAGVQLNSASVAMHPLGSRGRLRLHGRVELLNIGQHVPGGGRRARQQRIERAASDGRLGCAGRHGSRHRAVGSRPAGPLSSPGLSRRLRHAACDADRGAGVVRAERTVRTRGLAGRAAGTVGGGAVTWTTDGTEAAHRARRSYQLIAARLLLLETAHCDGMP